MGTSYVKDDDGQSVPYETSTALWLGILSAITVVGPLAVWLVLVGLFDTMGGSVEFNLACAGVGGLLIFALKRLFEYGESSDAEAARRALAATPRAQEEAARLADEWEAETRGRRKPRPAPDQ